MRTRRERIYAVGYYGWGNFGDELFRYVIRSNCQRLWGKRAKLRMFVAPFDVVRTSRGPIGAVARIVFMLLGSLWADRIVLCGGSVLSDVEGVARLRTRLFSKRRATEAIGVSLGPFNSEEAAQRVSEMIASMQRVIVRDAASGERARRSVVVGGDLAALHNMPIVPDSERSGLTICPSLDAGVDPLVLSTVLIDLLHDAGVRVVTLLALNSRKRHGDVEYCRDIASLLQRSGIFARVEAFRSLNQTISVISSSSAVWSQRLHGLITAYLCDVPVISLSHHAKLADFCADIGLAAECNLTSLEVGDDNRDAATQTLAGVRGWSLAPAEYVSRTRSAYDRVVGDGA